MPPTWNPGAITNKTTSTSAAFHGSRHHSSRLGKAHPALSRHKSGRLDRIVRVRRPERDDDGKGMARSDKNTRRATVKASEYKNGMDRLDQSASKPSVAAWCGEAARRISQAMLDPDTDAMKLFATLMGRPSIEQREQGRKPSVQHSVRLSEPMDEYVRRHQARGAGKPQRILSHARPAGRRNPPHLPRRRMTRD